MRPPFPVMEAKASVDDAAQAIARDAISSDDPSTSYCVQLTPELITAIRGVSAPGMTPGAGASRYPYNREPYGRARIPTAQGDLVVDGKVLMTEHGSLVEFWRDAGVLGILDVFIPAAWVEPIPRDASEWRHCYDILEDQ